MEWNWDALKVIVDLAQFIILGFVGWWQWKAMQSQRHDENREEKADDLETRVTDLEKSQGIVESKIEDLPTHTDLGNVYERLKEVSDEVKEMTGELRGTNRILQLLHEDRLQGGRRGY